MSTPDSAESIEHARRLAGTVIGTIVAAGVLTVSAAEDHPGAFDAGVYMVATVVVFWLAHGWAHSLGHLRSGVSRHALADGLRHEMPVLESALAPSIALALVAAVGGSDERAITIAIWVCVAELGFFGADAAWREGANPLRVAGTAAGCAALGVIMILLKAVVH